MSETNLSSLYFSSTIIVLKATISAGKLSDWEKVWIHLNHIKESEDVGDAPAFKLKASEVNMAASLESAFYLVKSPPPNNFLLHFWFFETAQKEQ